MAALPPAPERRRPRPGSLERPINGRLYRGTWLLVGLPAARARLQRRRPGALAAAAEPAVSLRQGRRTRPRRPTSRRAGRTAARHARERPAPPAGPRSSSRPMATRCGRSTSPPTSRVAAASASSTCWRSGRAARRRRSSCMAHRDDTGSGGGNDNASGTRHCSSSPAHSAHGGNDPRAAPVPARLPLDGRRGRRRIGASMVAAHAAEVENVIGVVNLDAIAGPRPPAARAERRHVPLARARTRRDGPRTARRRPAPSRRAPGALRQLVDLGFPFSLYEQAPFVTPRDPRRHDHDRGDRPAAGLHDERPAATATGSARSGGRPRTRSTRCRRASRSRPARRATSISAAGSSAAGRSSSC